MLLRMSLLSLVLGLLLLAQGRAAEPRRTEVIVYGGTPSGLIAAIAAAREGKSVLVLEPGRHIGGMVTGGLGATDTGNRAAIGGYAREFFQRVRDYYVKQYGADSEQVKTCSEGYHFEPHVATAVFQEMLKEAKVEVLLDQSLDKARKSGAHIASITTRKGDEFTASVWIDATYEGDLMARAGVAYTIGREAKGQYGESIAGVQARSPAHQWSVKLSPFAEDRQLLPLIQTGAAGEAGAGDKKVQAYNFRLCMTDRADNRVPFPKPVHYDPKRYELLARYLAQKPDVKVGQLMNPVRMPNGKTDTNNNGPMSTDHIGANWDYPEADEATRARIRQDHVEYSQGFLYFLTNDPRVPEALHQEINQWGLAKDEFTDTDHWPHQLYVREARRMIGAFLMTQNDIMKDRAKEESVGLGSYNTDSHHVQRIVGPDGFVLNEGDFQVPVQPYAIPYGSLVPRPAECDNLLVPVCLSATHVAYCTIRMEPVYMILGHAAGVAAALASDGKTPVQQVNVKTLQAKLTAQKSILAADKLAAGKRLDPAKLGGIVVDDAQATKTGDWIASTAQSPYVGEGYLHDGDQAKGKLRIRFIPKLPADGMYEVRLYYTTNANRATNVPVVIHHADGEQTVTVNQRQTLKEGPPKKLGAFRFTAGTSGWVEIRNDGTDGYVIADAVQFVSAGKQ